ncbi:MAG: 2-amino-4-hydroxy-6-hydroxymethyldihydropteridine diphosphokinase [Actinobacteria bacterium]|nr:MAG: 2-amino-4-hydroxy-6-hydroxymethyldihydropteridine diphosphokinase [Actinomycetota bacterium]
MSIIGVIDNPRFRLLVVAGDLAAAREVLGEKSPPGVRLAWTEPGVAPEVPLADDETWDDEPAPFWEEPEYDDPAALAAAEAAVRGPGAPVIPVTTSQTESPAGWRNLLSWPRLEEQRHKTLVYIALGSNLGDRAGNLAAALSAIGGLPDTEGLAVSRVYESEPWGGVEQPGYANAVAVVSTELSADQLLSALQEVEESLGRVRAERFGPRTIDLDILLFGDEEWVRPDLTIPHPRMLEREFVVVPLLEVDPDAKMPDGSSVGRQHATLGRITGVLGAVPGFSRVTVVSGDAADAPEPLEFPGEFIPAIDGSLEDEASWVTIESTTQGMLTSHSNVMELQVHLGVLQSAGIVAVIDPPPLFGSPGAPYYAIPERVRLMVPRECAAEARRTLLEALTSGRMTQEE